MFSGFSCIFVYFSFIPSYLCFYVHFVLFCFFCFFLNFHLSFYIYVLLVFEFHFLIFTSYYQLLSQPNITGIKYGPHDNAKSVKRSLVSAMGHHTTAKDPSCGFGPCPSTCGLSRVGQIEIQKEKKTSKDMWIMGNSNCNICRQFNIEGNGDQISVSLLSQSHLQT